MFVQKSCIRAIRQYKSLLRNPFQNDKKLNMLKLRKSGHSDFFFFAGVFYQYLFKFNDGYLTLCNIYTEQTRLCVKKAYCVPGHKNSSDD